MDRLTSVKEMLEFVLVHLKISYLISSCLFDTDRGKEAYIRNLDHDIELLLPH